jgi:hypothetical protein
VGDQPDARPLPPHNSATQKDENKYPCLEQIRGHDPTIQVAKSHALHVAATVVIVILKSSENVSDVIITEVNIWRRETVVLIKLHIFSKGMQF